MCREKNAETGCCWRPYLSECALCKCAKWLGMCRRAGELTCFEGEQRQVAGGRDLQAGAQADGQVSLAGMLLCTRAAPRKAGTDSQGGREGGRGSKGMLAAMQAGFRFQQADSRQLVHSSPCCTHAAGLTLTLKQLPYSPAGSVLWDCSG